MSARHSIIRSKRGEISRYIFSVPHPDQANTNKGYEMFRKIVFGTSISKYQKFILVVNILMRVIYHQWKGQFHALSSVAGGLRLRIQCCEASTVRKLLEIHARSLENNPTEKMIQKVIKGECLDFMRPMPGENAPGR